MTEPLDGEANEARLIADRYERRSADLNEYSLLRPHRMMANLDKQRVLLSMLHQRFGTDLSALRVLEVGAGFGDNLRLLIHWGVDPANVIGNDLLDDRLEHARRTLPAECTLHAGDARDLDITPGSQDIVMASTVFSSILDAQFRRQLASHMWTFVKPGGGVLWYDFTVDNPKNPDVTGIRQSELEVLFPDGEISVKRLTLAPPIARAVSRIHPTLYTGLRMVPLLRTHIAAWISK